MNKKLVKYISIAFLLSFVIGIIALIGLDFWGISSAIDRENRSQFSQEEYDEFIASENLRYYYQPKIDSLISVNPNNAIIYIDKVLGKYPNNHTLTLKKGLAYYHLDSLDQALYYFKKSNELNGFEFPKALGYIGWTLVDKKDYDAAIIELKKASKINHDFHYDIAEVYELKGDFPKALKHYQIVLENYESGRGKYTMWREIKDLKVKIDFLKKAGHG